MDKTRIASSDTISARLAAWAQALTYDGLHDAARKATVATVVDTVGLSLSARHEPYARAVVDSLDADGPCSVMGRSRGLDAGGAAFANGVAAHGEDFDNTFEGCPVHSGAVIVPAMLALGERDGLDGRTVTTAIAVGIEVMCRLGLVAKKGVHSAGFHPTSVLGTLACAGAAAKAMGLSAEQTAHAYGIAGSAASGIIEYLADGSSTKRMHAGWAAQAGIRAAMLARAGFDGPATVFEGTHGLFKAFAPSLEVPEFHHLTDGLGTRWIAADVAFKPYACGTMTQPYIDCMLSLRRQGLKPEDVASVVCEVGEGTVHRLWEPLALKQLPPSPYGAKFSTPYCLAVALVDGDAGLAQFSDARIADARIQAMAGKVTYVIDPDNEYPANYTGHVRVTCIDGRVLEARQGCLRGGVREPMTLDELKAKYRANTGFAGLGQQAAEHLLAALLDLPNRSDLTFLKEVAHDDA
jgi:2-methylcitrate dehydratase PrpD